jgi:hypothetical protein
LPYPGHELAPEFFTRLLADPQRHIGVDALTLEVVRVAHDRGFGYLGMRDKRALNLGSAEPMARDIDHVVHPARQPIVSVPIAPYPVPGKIEPRKG